ncbi:MAG: RIP metalloprotease RseP [Clostridia bacterium]|nr:RIP metalloprotease RseP [Clostridia bacterium]
MYALAFMVVIGLVVFVHELGHFLAARASGVRVYEFALGFGPRILSKRVGETLYAVRALPLGGMCRFAGMDDTDMPGEKSDDDDPRSFVNRPFIQRIFIVIAGPLMNFLLAVVVFSALFGVYGVPTATVAEVLQGTPASEAGFAPNDTILAVDGAPVASVAGFVNTVAANWNRSLTVDVRRDGERMSLQVVPAYDPEVKVGRIGVKLSEVPVRTGPAGSVSGALRYTWGIVNTSVVSMKAMISGRAKPDVSGPIGIATMSAQAARAGFSSLMMLVALISTSLGLLNLMPVPILDGGWVVLLAIEQLRGRPLSEGVEGGLKLAGLVLLFALMVYATVGDISRLVGSHF